MDLDASLLLTLLQVQCALLAVVHAWWQQRRLTAATTRQRINPPIPARPDLRQLDDETALAHLRFTIAEITTIVDVLGLPAELHTADRHRVSSLEAVCVVLYRLSWPTRLNEAIRFFGRDRSAVSRIFNLTVGRIHDQFGAMLYLHPSLSTQRMQFYADAITTSHPIIHNVWGFIDGTCNFICRPGAGLQRICYSGHKKTHCLKFQLIVAADGLILSTYGGIAGSRNDLSLLQYSKIKQRLAAISTDDNGRTFMVYGDGGYVSSGCILAPYRLAATPLQIVINKAHSAARVMIENAIGRVKVLMSHCQLQQKQKLRQQQLAPMFLCSVLFTNIRTIMDGGNFASARLACAPQLSLHEYLHWDEAVNAEQ